MKKIILSYIIILWFGITKAQVVTIPDANFKAALISAGVDINQNNQIETSEALDVSFLDLSKQNITDITGIKAFSNLVYLNLYKNSLITLDVSGCRSLTYLACDLNKLTTLKFSGCTSLTELHASNNQLKTLDVKDLKSLTILDCGANQLTSLNVTGCTSLTGLYFGSNSLTSVNVSGCTSLNELHASDQQLTSLDVSGCKLLTNLICYNNKLTTLDVSGCTLLTYLVCYNNKLTTLDVSGCKFLTNLNCFNNQLTTLDVTGLISLTDLVCSYNQITSLNVSSFKLLTNLVCCVNKLTTLDVSGCTLLTTLNCFDNQLTSLDVVGLRALKNLDCPLNNLTSLDVSGTLLLTNLDCSFNEITSLDVSGCLLTKLDCSLNKLYYLNLANNYNTKIVNFSAIDNPYLNCIKVDDAIWSKANWKNIDSQTVFSDESCDLIYALKVFNIDSQKTQRELKMENLSIAADGSASTVFEYQGPDKENISLRFIGEPLISNPDFYGSFEPSVPDGDVLKFVYNHPTFFSESKLDEYRNSQFRKLTIQVKNNLTGDILIEYHIKIVRPSVLMAHGIWSNGEDGFGKMETRLLAEKIYKTYQLLKLNYISNQHNEQSLSSYEFNKNKLKQMALDNNISMGKIDVLGHSNGGLLSRLYIQNDYQYDINKLITFNTPHSGSQIANLVLDPEYNYLREILNIFGKFKNGIINVDNGIIEDLTVDGDFIYKLNSQSNAVVQYSNIGLHTITSNELVSNVTGGWLGVIAANYFLGVDDTELFFQNTVFKRSKHDVIVSDESQIGGCESTTPFTKQKHTGSTENLLIQQRTIELLNQSPKNPVYFSLNGYNPVTLSPPVFKNPNKFHNKNTSSETITILSPIEGASYNAGQEVNIVVNGTAGLEKIVTSMGSSNVTIQNHVDKNVTSANFNFTIPIDALGRLEIVSAGYSSNGYENMASTFINVTTTAVLESLSVDDDNIYVSEGQKAPITILGHYDDGVARDITNIIGLNYVFDNNNAEVTESGLITGILSGDDVLTITYLGKTTTVPITIEKSDNLSNKDNDLFTGVLIYPNPNKGNFNLSINSISNGDYDVSITDTLGRMIYKQKQKLQLGNNIVPLNIEQSGIYFVTISDTKRKATRKVIVNK